MRSNDEHRVCVAQIGAPHGVRGEVRLHSFTQEPMAVAAYGPLNTEDGSRTFEIETVRAAKDHLVARLAGISDRDAAEALRNIKLYVPRDSLPPVEDDETFYHADLVGLVAVDESGAEIGSVSAVQNYGAGDILEIAPGGGREPLLLPFNELTVPKVDLKARRIVVVPQATSE